MKEIVVISGKGGTGKTSLTASFAQLEGRNAVVADCDVDAADMHLLLQPDYEFSDEFYSGELAYIEQANCTRCGKCAKVCRFDAIALTNRKFVVDPFSCEGCGYCARICPTNTIINKKRLAGDWYISNIKTGSTMVHARLRIGADNSGKLVAKVKSEAKDIAFEERKNLILVDGPPGIGCPVVSSLSGADFAVLITEPSVSGIHDLKRIYQLIKQFNIQAGCIINKADINTTISTEIVDFLNKENILHISNISYDENFTKAMTLGKTVVEYSDGQLSKTIEDSWKKIKQHINNIS